MQRETECQVKNKKTKKIKRRTEVTRRIRTSMSQKQNSKINRKKKEKE